MDALTHPTICNSLRSVGLIGPANDIESLKSYLAQLTRHYIKEQLLYYPNSLDKAETFIVMCKRVFDDEIIHNATPIANGSLFSKGRCQAVIIEINCSVDVLKG